MRADITRPELDCRMELGVCSNESSYALDNLESWMQPEPAGLSPDPDWQRIVRDPRGVVLIIGPWNCPVELLVVPLVGAWPYSQWRSSDWTAGDPSSPLSSALTNAARASS